MKRAVLLISALLACAAAKAQTGDAALLRRASFDAPPAAVADSLADSESFAAVVDRQLAGSCPFDPDHRTFFRQAVKKAGVVRAIVFTADRLTRSGRIGTSQHHHFSEDGIIHEGLEAYLPPKEEFTEP